jgi:hypothetical protein
VGLFFAADTQGVTTVFRSGSQEITPFVTLNNGEIWLIQIRSFGASLFASGLSDPNGMAYLPGHGGSGGDLYVADRGTGQIWKYNLDGVGSVFVSDAGTPNYLR